MQRRNNAGVRGANRRLVSAAALLALGVLAATSAQATDLIVHNARITTLDDARPEASALAVDKGKIVAVGSDAAVLRLRTKATRVIDGQRRRLIPGLNDSHSHYIRGGLSWNAELRWDGVPNLAEGLRMIREQADRTPEGQWVRVLGGWTPWQFPERRMPTRAELDAASPERPVYIQYFYSRAVLNTVGLAAMGLTRDSPSAQGTRLEKNAAGELTGVLIADPHPALMYEAAAKLPALTEQQQRSSTLRLFVTLARYGVTSVVDAGGGGHDFPEDYGVATALAAQGALPVRADFNLFAQRPGRELEDFRTWTGTYRAGQGFSQIKHAFDLHGGGEFLVWSATDFENFQSARPEIRPEARPALADVVRLLVERRWPFALHATYDETASVILDVIEQVNRDTPLNGLRFSIDHAETISDRNILRVRALGGGINVQSRMVMLGDDFVERYGATAARRTPPVRRILELGVPLGIGTDATRGSTFNPWITLHWLVTGQTASGRVLYGPENRLSRLEALRAHTVGSAWFSGDEGRKGRIADGQFADFALLSDDYFSVPEAAIENIEAVLTISDGRVAFASGPYAALNPPAPAVVPAWGPAAHFQPYWSAQPPRRRQATKGAPPQAQADRR